MNDPRYEEIERSAVSPTLISLGIYDNDSAKAFVERLLPGERKLLYDIIGRKRAEQYHMTEANDTAEVHSEDLVKLWWVNSIPYCGYGFFDTSMMIVVGESVDRTIGLYVGISIMAAAAVGNIVSNLIGIGLVHYVEIFLLRYFNVRTPHLTVKQTNHWTVRYVSNCAKITGLLIGCIIGMFPLLFYDAPARIHRCCVEAYETEAENSDLEIKEAEKEAQFDLIDSFASTLDNSIFNEYEAFRTEKNNSQSNTFELEDACD
uniref:Transmembrane protein n=1 Tax=Panagrellus redivivus TaxID=6233 RepID=A0A7E4W9S6_PANRE